MKSNHKSPPQSHREQFFAGPGDDGPAKPRLKGGLFGAGFFLLPGPRFPLLFRAVFHVPSEHPETMKKLFEAEALEARRNSFFDRPGDGGRSKEQEP
jgi:hypothetical protein